MGARGRMASSRPASLLAAGSRRPSILAACCSYSHAACAGAHRSALTEGSAERALRPRGRTGVYAAGASGWASFRLASGPPRPAQHHQRVRAGIWLSGRYDKQIEILAQGVKSFAKARDLLATRRAGVRRVTPARVGTVLGPCELTAYSTQRKHSLRLQSFSPFI